MTSISNDRPVIILNPNEYTLYKTTTRRNRSSTKKVHKKAAVNYESDSSMSDEEEIIMDEGTNDSYEISMILPSL